ncbi:hypothetical protein ACIP4Y_33040 [Streptomyces sp. NPDC088810]|uniref:hypothetical protein n=1 Tax=Streptomyces sp. NPDC088810 TaxID=3365904 RepID=UPI0037F61BAE
MLRRRRLVRYGLLLYPFSAARLSSFVRGRPVGRSALATQKLADVLELGDGHADELVEGNLFEGVVSGIDVGQGCVVLVGCSV